VDDFDRLVLDLIARLTPVQRRAAFDVAKRADDSAAQERRWVQELSEVVDAFDRLGARTPWPFFHLFWIRLHGVFRELLDKHRVFHDMQKLHPHRPSYADYGARIYLAAREMLDALDESEHVAADYFRQRSAHLRQSAYTVRVAKSGRDALDRRTIDHIDRTFTIDEIDEKLRALINQYGSDLDLAVHLARKVRPHVVALSEAMEALHQLPRVL
jgi:hypothetical protein